MVHCDWRRTEKDKLHDLETYNPCCTVISFLKMKSRMRSAQSMSCQTIDSLSFGIHVMTVMARLANQELLSSVRTVQSHLAVHMFRYWGITKTVNVCLIHSVPSSSTLPALKESLQNQCITLFHPKRSPSLKKQQMKYSW